MNWQTYFLNLVYLIAERSKDTSTHVGAVIVKPDNSIVSTGYNGLPYGVEDCIRWCDRKKVGCKCRYERPYKYLWTVHAEENSLLLAARNGVSTLGCAMYTNGIPCTNCAKSIIQAGIVRVYVDSKWKEYANPKWVEEAEVSLEMFNEVDIQVVELDVDLIKVRRFINGKEC